MRRKNLRSLNPYFVECVTYREDYGLWLDRYFCPGRNLICDEDAYHDLAGDVGQGDGSRGAVADPATERRVADPVPVRRIARRVP
jgi:hypothetical protein